MPDETGWFGLPKPSPEERAEALKDPGPSWRTWFFSSFAKVYLGLAFLIVDAVDAAAFLGPPIQPTTALAAAGTLAALVYAQYVAVQYLWHLPSRTETVPATGWRRAVHPFPYGRWTEEGARFRRGELRPTVEGPNPEEFL